jgi:hypothetical protein
VDITVHGYNGYHGYGFLCVEEPERVQVFTYMHLAMDALWRLAGNKPADNPRSLRQGNTAGRSCRAAQKYGYASELNSCV